MFKFNTSIVPNKVHIGWHFPSNKYAYRDAYSAHKSNKISIQSKTPDVKWIRKLSACLTIFFIYICKFCLHIFMLPVLSQSAHYNVRFIYCVLSE